MKKNIYKIWLVILTGLVFSLALTAMILSGSRSVNPFYNVGTVSDIRETFFRNDSHQNLGHQESSGKFVLDQGKYVLTFQALGNTNEWNYLCVWIKELTTESVQWDITYETTDGNITSEVYTFDLTDGLNLIPVEKNSFDVVRAEISGENGTSFYITNMQFRENAPVFAWGKAISIFSLIFVLFCCLAFIVFTTLKKLNIRWNPYCWIEILQELYILIGEQLKKIVSFLPQTGRMRAYCRTGLFLVIFLYSAFVEIKGTYYTEFKCHLFVYTVFLLLIAVLSIRNKLEKKNWNHSLVWSWLVLWIVACISDFIVPKYFRFTGYVMAFAVGFLIFIWNNMQKLSELIKDFTKAVHYFFVIITIFCLFCRPESEVYRYSGFVKNPSVFALYLGTCWAVVLGEIDSRIQEGEKLKKLLPYIVEGCLVLSFCWKSQSAGPLLCMGGLAFIWLFRMVRRTRNKMIRKSLIAVVISAAVLIIPANAALTWGLRNIASEIGTGINYDGETTALRIKTVPVVYAAEEGESAHKNRLEQKFSSPTLSQILSGRDYYYRTYLRDMNLFGHTSNPKMWGHRRLPHNAVLGIAHRYGIFATVPYLVMLVATIGGTIRFGRQKVKYAVVPFYVCLSTIVMSMADNIEQPFVWLPWIGLYVMMGCAFTGGGDRN